MNTDAVLGGDRGRLRRAVLGRFTIVFLKREFDAPVVGDVTVRHLESSKVWPRPARFTAFCEGPIPERIRKSSAGVGGVAGRRKAVFIAESFCRTGWLGF